MGIKINFKNGSYIETIESEESKRPTYRRQIMIKTTYTESGVCDVCKKQSEYTIVCSSSCGAMSYRYCLTCLNAGREPYSALTSMGIKYKQVSESFRQRILDPSLRFFDKTPEDFDKDVEEYYSIFVNAQEPQDYDRTKEVVTQIDCRDQEQSGKGEN